MKVFIFILAFVVTASEPLGNGLLHFFAIIALWASFVGVCAKESNRANFCKTKKS